MIKKRTDIKGDHCMKILRNNIFLLKCAGKQGRPLLFIKIILQIYWTIGGIYRSVLLPAILVYCITSSFGMAYVLLAVAIMFVILLLDATLVNYLQNIYIPKKENQLDENTRCKIFELIQKVDFTCFDDSKFYDNCLLTSNNLSGKIQGCYGNCAQLIGTVLGITINTAAIASISYSSLVVLIVALILVGVPQIVLAKVNLKLNKVNLKNQRKFNFITSVYTSIWYAKELKNRDFLNTVKDHYDDTYKDAQRILKRFIPAYSTATFIQNIGLELILKVGLLFYLCYEALVLHKIDYVNIIVIYNATMNLYGTISGLSSILIGFGDNSNYVTEFRKVLEYEPEMKSGTVSMNGKPIESISIQDMKFAYKGNSKETLRGINLELKKNQKIALVGRNGTGKTTLLKLLLRFYDADEGKILVNGQDIRNYDLEEYRRSFGVLFQDVSVLDATVRENIKLTEDLEGTEAEVEDALISVGLNEKVNNLIHGMDTMMGVEIDDRGAILSGGEQQRILLARAISTHKSVVLLDEPTSHMDTISEVEFYKDVFKTLEDKMVIYITHRLISTINADQIIVFDKDTIVEVGTHQELMEKKGSYYRMFKVQQKLLRLGEAYE